MYSSWRRAVTTVGGPCLLAGWALGRWSSPEKSQTSSASYIRLPGYPLQVSVSAAGIISQPPSYPVDVDTAQPPPSSKSVARVSQIMRFGFPGLDHVRSYSDFVLSYDRRCRLPAWVFEHLTAERVRKQDGTDRAQCQFLADQSIHPYFRASNADFRGSGYDRGHMAAARNHSLSQQHLAETFLLSNMAPQVGVGFNRDKWNELEMYVRKLCYRYANVYVCTGPLFLPRRDADGKLRVVYEVIGANNVAVPTHFFKIVVAETDDGALDMESYVLPNQAIGDSVPLASFFVAPEVVERAAGLLFFDKVERNKVRRVNGQYLKR